MSAPSDRGARGDDASRPRSAGRPGDRIAPVGVGGVLATLIGVVTVGLMVLFSADLYTRYVSAIANAERSAQGLADVLAEQTEDSFKTIGLALDAVELVRHNAGHSPAIATNAALALLRRSSPLLTGIGWTDAAGDMIAHSYERDPPRPNVADLDVFTAQRDGTGVPFLIAVPFRSVSSGRWISAMSRRLSEPDGSFAGIVAAGFDPATLSPIHKAMRPGRGGTVALIRRDGVILAREPFVESVMGRPVSPGSRLLDLLSTTDAGTFENTSPIDGVARLIAFRAVSGLPLAMVVTYDRSEVLAPVYRHAAVVGPLILALIVVVLLGGTILSHKNAALARQSELLHESEARYRSLVEDQTELVSLAAPDGTLRFVNLAFARLLGSATEAFVGRNLFEFVAPDAQAAVADHLRRVRDARHSVESLNQVVLPSGQRRWIAWSNRALTDADGNVTAVHSVGRDVTLRIDAQRRLEESEARYRLLVEHATAGLVAIDQHGIIRNFNPACERIFGYTADEAIGQNVRILMPEPFHDVHDGYLADYVRTGQGAIIGTAGRELSAKRRDGSVFPIDISLSTYAADGERFFYGIIRDITAKRAMEAALRDSELRYRLLAENSMDMIFRADLDGVRRYVSPASRDIVGYAPEELIGRTPFEMIHPDDRQQVQDAFRAVLGGQERAMFTPRVRHRDGHWVWAEVQLRVLRDGVTGAPSGLLGTLRDVSAKKEAEHRMAEAYRQVEALNKELEDFAYAASHDLKAPLRVINNAVQWLEEDLAPHLTEDTRAHMDLMHRRIARMEKLLDDLLEYARVGRTTDRRNVASVPGDAMMQNILLLLSPPAGFTVKIDPAFADIRVPVMPLQQILMNLIGNAVKHHHRRDGRVEVAVEDRGAAWEFTVTDDGPGIAPEFHDQIFEMFTTLKPRDKVEGSGMGLAFVRKNIELFGGRLDLDSAVGRGSIFRFTWPKQPQIARHAA